MNRKKKNLKTKILNKFLISGKKRTVEKIVFESVKRIQKKHLKNSKLIIKSALLNSSPITRIKQVKKKKRKVKEFTMILKKDLRINEGINLILLNSKKKSTQSFTDNFINEIIESSKYKSSSVGKKETLHENSFLNRKHLYYRWF